MTESPRAVLLGLLAACAIVSLPAITVGLDNDFSKLYATDSDDDRFRLVFRDVFGANDGLFVAVLRPEDPADPEFIETLDRLTRDTARDPVIARVYSPTHTALPVDVDDVLVFGPLFGPSSAFQGTHDERVRRMAASPLGQRLVSEDGRSYVLAGEVRKEATSYESLLAPDRRFRERVNQAVSNMARPVEVHFAGIPRTRIHATHATEGDLLYLSPLVVFVLSVVMLMLVRSLWAVLMTLGAVGLAVSSTAGVVGLFRDDLNFVTVLYPIFLTAVTTAHCIHLLHQFRWELDRAPDDRIGSIRRSAERVARAALLTSLTTAIGFGSLMAAEATILRTFGLYLSIAVLVSFVIVSFLLPSAMTLLGPRLFDPRPRPSRITLPPRYEPFLDRLTSPRGARWTIAFGFTLLLGIAYYARGVPFDYILSDHGKGSPALLASNDLVDQDLGGIVPIEVSFLGAEDDFRSASVLQKMQASADWLEEHFNTPPPIGVSTVVAEVNEQFGGEAVVPDSDAAVAQLLLVAESSSDRIVSQLVTDDYSHARLRTSSVDRGAAGIVSMWRRFDSFAEEVFDGTGIRVRMTGGMVVGYEGMQQLSSGLLRSVLVALVLVILVIGIAFRSAGLALASILPNILPVVVGLALLRATGSVVNPIPGLVFCIGIGLSVDDTIHLFSRYREEQRRGASSRDAARLAVRRTHTALLQTTIVLSIGMGLLLLSRSDLNRTMGWLSGAVFATALAADLVLTPAILAMLPDAEQPERARGVSVPAPDSAAE
ncbi:MAG: MMPL family transporter [Myxococcota bacterium]